MTRDQRYLALIGILIDYTKELSENIPMTSYSRNNVHNVLNRVEKLAKEI